MIRRTQEADAEAIEVLDAELFTDVCWNANTILKEIKLGWGLVATTEKGKVIGFLMTRLDGDLADVIRVGVSKKHQHKGYGRLMLKQAIEMLSSPMMLTVRKDNQAARKLYMGEGFEPIASMDDAIILMRAQA